MAEAQSFPVGQAPWEQSAPPAAVTAPAFPVGQAPWEQQTAPQVAPAPPVSGKLDAAARVLDYPGGMARDTLAGIAGAVTGKNIVTPQDVANADVGKGTRSAEYLRRLGVTEGGSINIPFIGKTTARDIEGFGLDVATDPLTAFASAIKELPQVGKYLSEVTGLGANASAEKVGAAIYKAGFSKIDAKMAENGAEPLSQLMLEHGAPTGTTSQLADKIQGAIGKMGQVRNQLYGKATQLGAAVDLTQPLERAESYVSTLLADGRASVRAQGQALAEHLQSEYKAAGTVDLPTLSSWKTDLYNTLPKNFFEPSGKMTNVGKKFNAALAQDFREAIVDTGNRAQEGLGDSIETLNSKWGTLLDSVRPVAQQVKQAAAAPIVSPLKAVITAHSPLLGAVMEGADLAKTTAVRTNVGKGLMNAAGNNLGALGGVSAGDVARQTLGQVMSGNSGVNSLRQAGGTP